MRVTRYTYFDENLCGESAGDPYIIYDTIMMFFQNIYYAVFLQTEEDIM